MSHELKGLVGILVLAIAAWVWANTLSPYSGDVMGVSPGTRVGAQGPAPAGAPGGEAAGETQAGETPAGEAGTTDETGPPQPGAGPPVPGSPAGARQLRIATLPFLVTDEPIFEEVVPAEASPLLRTQGARASVNPFAPIVVRTPAGAELAPDPATIQPTPVTPTPAVVDVPIRQPEGTLAAPADAALPEAPVLPPTAPAPSAALPGAPAVGRLPRALPSGTLPVAPALLSQQRGQVMAAVAPPPQVDLSSRVAVALPRGSASGVAPAERPEPERAMTAGLSEPAPLFSVRSGAAAVDGGMNGAPITGSLRSYLLEHEVTYTGSVLGPVGVGIFRTNRGTVVVPLGQTLPQSSIVLTDLNGQWAELALADSKEILPIDTRR